MNLSRAAGSGPRAEPRRSTLLASLAFLLLALVLTACGQSDASQHGGTDAGASGSTAGTGTSAGGAASGGTGRPGAALPTQVGEVTLQVVSYPVPDVLDAAGGAELSGMLGALGLTADDVSLVIGVDPQGRLDIGRWQLPGCSADAIRSAWRDVAGSGWQDDTLAGEAALAGHGADGSQAWAVARDGVFLYVVTQDRALAEAALEATD